MKGDHDGISNEKSDSGKEGNMHCCVMRICHIQQTMASDRVKSLEKTLTWLNLETITAFKKRRKKKRRRSKKEEEKEEEE